MILHESGLCLAFARFHPDCQAPRATPGSRTATPSREARSGTSRTALIRQVALAPSISVHGRRQRLPPLRGCRGSRYPPPECLPPVNTRWRSASGASRSDCGAGQKHDASEQDQSLLSAWPQVRVLPGALSLRPPIGRAFLLVSAAFRALRNSCVGATGLRVRVSDNPAGDGFVRSLAGVLPENLPKFRCGLSAVGTGRPPRRGLPEEGKSAFRLKEALMSDHPWRHESRLPLLGRARHG